MKKTLLAAALLAGFAGVAQAETQVTLYGIVDAGFYYTKVTDRNSHLGMVSGGQSGTRWGLRGTEDLGDGLQAIFTLESGVKSTDGKHTQSDRLMGRQATVGLASANWGKLELGRQSSIASKYMGAVDPFGNGFTPGVGGNMGNAFGYADTVRYDNQILYQTPTFSGFGAGIGYSFNNDGDVSVSTPTTNTTRALTLGLKYSAGPLYVALTYDQRNLPHNKNSPADPRAYGIAASYDFEVAKLALAYARTTDIVGSGAANGLKFGDTVSYDSNSVADGIKSNSYLVGVTVPVGKATNILASYQALDPSGYKTAFNPTGKGSIGDSTEHNFSLGLTYNLSKRTNLYAIGSYTKHYAFNSDLNASTIGAGIRHQF